MHSRETNDALIAPKALAGDRRRILFLDHTAAMGGGEIALFNLVRHLDRAKYDPLVLLFTDGPLAARLRAAGVETRVIAFSKRVLKTGKDTLGLATLLRLGDVLRTLSYVLTLARFMRREGIDLVHTNSLKSDIIGGLAARLARKPLVWHVRDRIEGDYLPTPVVRVFRWLCQWLPDRVIANSAATLETVQLRETSRGHVVHSGIDWQDAPAANGASHRSERLVGLIGRISPWKGQHIFVEAAAQVRQRFPDTRFQIIGAPLFEERDYEQRVRALASARGLNGHVEFLGFRPDIPDIVRRLDILVHASTTGEPFGQVVVEGMAAGKPVVATNGGGIPEIVVDGVTGLLVPMGDAQAMARAICRVLDDPKFAGELGAQGRRRVADHFTISHTISAVQAIYDKVLVRRDYVGPTD